MAIFQTTDTPVANKSLLYSGWIPVIPTSSPCTFLISARTTHAPLGSGSYASVARSRAMIFDINQPTELDVAVRTLELSSYSGKRKDQLQSLKNAITREVALASSWDHPHIAKPLAYSSSNNLSEQFIVYPFYANGTVHEFFQNPLVLIGVRVYAIDRIVDAIRYLHSRGYIHGDIRSQNVMMDGTRAVVIDFDRVRRVDEAPLDDTGNGGGGNCYWTSPERFSTEGSPGSQADDVYSIGLLMLSVLMGKEPYHEMSFNCVMAARLKDEPPARSSDFLSFFQSERWGELAASCWKPVADRPDIYQVAEKVKQLASNHYRQTHWRPPQET